MHLHNLRHQSVDFRQWRVGFGQCDDGYRLQLERDDRFHVGDDHQRQRQREWNGQLHSSAKPTTSARSATLTVAGKTFTVNQAAGSCSYTVTPASLSTTIAGGSGSLTVTTSAGCAWTTSTSVNWISIAGSGSASGVANYFITAYTGGGGLAGRTGTITIAGKTITVTQGAAPAPPAPQGLRLVIR